MRSASPPARARAELGHEALGRPHRRYLESAVRTRDDTGCVRHVDPGCELRLPRW
ncbi:hypothetical protein AB0958_26310 [Streptomyces sp. NPDC006655]|uniref:hypothetical protein n=1 Tax=Streptomyces sp. NPDC006655 TaxID=3156898 RepID=UPI0034536E43